jgi:thymidylate synthase
MALIDTAYKVLCEQVLRNGYVKPSRVGETLSLPGLSIKTWNVEQEFPVLSSRKIYLTGILGELAAFLRGATMLREFKEQGCNYWDHNASQWKRNAGVPQEDWEVGHIYGAAWRNWGSTELDQIAALVAGIKADPYGRRHLLTTWNPEKLADMALPPCHLLAQFYAHNDTLDCIVYMRSVDLALGLPSDLVLYGALLMLVAKETGMQAGRLHMQFGDAHVYKPHIEKLTAQLQRFPPALGPAAALTPSATLDSFTADMFHLYDYQPLEAIKYELL